MANQILEKIEPDGCGTLIFGVIVFWLILSLAIYFA